MNSSNFIALYLNYYVLSKQNICNLDKLKVDFITKKIVLTIRKFINFI